MQGQLVVRLDIVEQKFLAALLAQKKRCSRGGGAQLINPTGSAERFERCGGLFANEKILPENAGTARLGFGPVGEELAALVFQEHIDFFPAAAALKADHSDGAGL